MADEKNVVDLGAATVNKDLVQELIAAALADGSLVQETAEVSAEDKASKKTGKKTFIRYVAMNVKGMAALCKGKIDAQTAKPKEGEDTRTDEQKAAGVCDYFNYAFDLNERARVRGQILTAIEGPDKQIEKAADVFVKAMGWSKDKALEFVRAQRVEAGLPV